MAEQRPDYLPVIVLIALAGAIGLAIWLFPYFQQMVQRQDCIAVGRQDCN